MSESDEELNRIQEYKRRINRDRKHAKEVEDIWTEDGDFTSAWKEKFAREEVLNRNKGELRKAIIILATIGIILFLVFSCMSDSKNEYDKHEQSNDYMERVKEAAEKEFPSRDAAYCLQNPNNC